MVRKVGKKATPKTNREIAIEQWQESGTVAESGPCVRAFEYAVTEFQQNLGGDEWEAIIALRDYAQLRLAEIQDQRLEETKQRIAALASEIEKCK